MLVLRTRDLSINVNSVARYCQRKRISSDMFELSTKSSSEAFLVRCLIVAKPSKISERLRITKGRMTSAFGQIRVLSVAKLCPATIPCGHISKSFMRRTSSLCAQIVGKGFQVCHTCGHTGRWFTCREPCLCVSSVAKRFWARIE